VSAPAETPADVGTRMHELVTRLYPICRSITGNGLRETLRALQELVPLELHEVPSGTPVLDWTIPPEWNIRDAYVKNGDGNRVVDFRRSNLHIVSYSVPVHRRLTLAELRPHLHTLPSHPSWIPYRTSYYREDWGFCLRHDDLLALEEGDYEVCIDSTLEPGSLTYGELVLPGELEHEILVSAHVCHPSLANDNLSAVAVATFLAQAIAELPRRHGFRFLFVPGTIGAITWLALNPECVRRILHGLVLTGLGDPGPVTYKRSRRGDAPIDVAAAHVLRHSAPDSAIEDFTPYGYDERQYCSPGFDLGVGCLMRTPRGRYPEYHTSADNPGFVRPESLADSFETALAIVHAADQNRYFERIDPRGEPHLAKHGLDLVIAGYPEPSEMQLALLWVLNLSDGRHSLLDVAERAGMRIALIREAAEHAQNAGVIRERG
jgi:aminopeptidase-like protein